MPASIKVISAYHAQSHDHWYKELQTLPYNWSLHSLSPRYFSWRIRGNPLSYFDELTKMSDCDLLLCTSMVDLATIKGLDKRVSELPCLLYFHENQFAYPINQQQGILEAQITSLYSAISADSIAFNSEYNRLSFFQGADKFLKKMPDHKPKNLLKSLENKSQVIHVPIPCSTDKPDISITEPIKIVWNHRWEYDKNPELLEAFLSEMTNRKMPFKISIVGQQFRKKPEIFERIKTKFEENIEAWGFVDKRQNYEAVLDESHFVLSTADHDFQGISMLEAVARGCIPIAPKDLAYPEFFDEPFLYNKASTQEKSAINAVDCISRHLKKSYELPKTSHLEISNLGNIYRKWFDSFLV